VSRALPLQNRVDPWGALHAVRAKGTRMGNRGILHDADQRIVRQWASRAWVTCVLSFDRLQPRKPFSPGTYSELFFLDEATAMAAGHRPCRYCQRARFDEFKAGWLSANPSSGPSLRLIPEIDRIVHDERLTPQRTKRTFDAALSTLPFGTFIEHEEKPHLVVESGLLCWSFEGYVRGNCPPGSEVVKVLTPASFVRLFRHGFRPFVHASADVIQ